MVHKIWFKLIAVVLIQAFFCLDISWAAGGDIKGLSAHLAPGINISGPDLAKEIELIVNLRRAYREIKQGAEHKQALIGRNVIYSTVIQNKLFIKIDDRGRERVFVISGEIENPAVSEMTDKNTAHIFYVLYKEIIDKQHSIIVDNKKGNLRYAFIRNLYKEPFEQLEDATIITWLDKKGGMAFAGNIYWERLTPALKLKEACIGIGVKKSNINSISLLGYANGAPIVSLQGEPITVTKDELETIEEFIVRFKEEIWVQLIGEHAKWRVYDKGGNLIKAYDKISTEILTGIKEGKQLRTKIPPGGRLYVPNSKHRLSLSDFVGAEVELVVFEGEVNSIKLITLDEKGCPILRLDDEGRPLEFKIIDDELILRTMAEYYNLTGRFPLFNELLAKLEEILEKFKILPGNLLTVMQGLEKNGYLVYTYGRWELTPNGLKRAMGLKKDAGTPEAPFLQKEKKETLQKSWKSDEFLSNVNALSFEQKIILIAFLNLALNHHPVVWPKEITEEIYQSTQEKINFPGRNIIDIIPHDYIEKIDIKHNVHSYALTEKGLAAGMFLEDKEYLFTQAQKLLKERRDTEATRYLTLLAEYLRRHPVTIENIETKIDEALIVRSAEGVGWIRSISGDRITVCIPNLGPDLTKRPINIVLPKMQLASAALFIIMDSPALRNLVGNSKLSAEQAARINPIIKGLLPGELAYIIQMTNGGNLLPPDDREWGSKSAGNAFKTGTYFGLGAAMAIIITSIVFGYNSSIGAMFAFVPGALFHYFQAVMIFLAAHKLLLNGDGLIEEIAAAEDLIKEPCFANAYRIARVLENGEPAFHKPTMTHLPHWLQRWFLGHELAHHDMKQLNIRNEQIVSLYHAYKNCGKLLGYITSKRIEKGFFVRSVNGLLIIEWLRQNFQQVLEQQNFSKPALHESSSCYNLLSMAGLYYRLECFIHIPEDPFIRLAIFFTVIYLIWWLWWERGAGKIRKGLNKFFSNLLRTEKRDMPQGRRERRRTRRPLPSSEPQTGREKEPSGMPEPTPEELAEQKKTAPVPSVSEQGIPEQATVAEITIIPETRLREAGFDVDRFIVLELLLEYMQLLLIDSWFYHKGRYYLAKPWDMQITRTEIGDIPQHLQFLEDGDRLLPERMQSIKILGLHGEGVRSTTFGTETARRFVYFYDEENNKIIILTRSDWRSYSFDEYLEIDLAGEEKGLIKYYHEGSYAIIGSLPVSYLFSSDFNGDLVIGGIIEAVEVKIFSALHHTGWDYYYLSILPQAQNIAFSYPALGSKEIVPDNFRIMDTGKSRPIRLCDYYAIDNQDRLTLLGESGRHLQRTLAEKFSSAYNLLLQDGIAEKKINAATELVLCITGIIIIGDRWATDEISDDVIKTLIEHFIKNVRDKNNLPEKIIVECRVENKRWVYDRQHGEFAQIEDTSLGISQIDFPDIMFREQGGGAGQNTMAAEGLKNIALENLLYVVESAI
ncbi:MAG: hypothetical protein ABH952_12495 [Candidatus Omnitrophota bacterium]